MSSAIRAPSDQATDRLGQRERPGLGIGEHELAGLGLDGRLVGADPEARLDRRPRLPRPAPWRTRRSTRKPSVAQRLSAWRSSLNRAPDQVSTAVTSSAEVVGLVNVSRKSSRDALGRAQLAEELPAVLEVVEQDGCGIVIVGPVVAAALAIERDDAEAVRRRYREEPRDGQPAASRRARPGRAGRLATPRRPRPRR